MRTWGRDAVLHREACAEARWAGGRGELAHHPDSGVGRRAVQARRRSAVHRRHRARGADRWRRTGRASSPRSARSRDHDSGAAPGAAGRARLLCSRDGSGGPRRIAVHLPGEGRHGVASRARRAHGRRPRGAAAAAGTRRHRRSVLHRGLHRRQPCAVPPVRAPRRRADDRVRALGPGAAGDRGRRRTGRPAGDGGREHPVRAVDYRREPALPAGADRDGGRRVRRRHCLPPRDRFRDGACLARCSASVS